MKEFTKNNNMILFHSKNNPDVNKIIKVIKKAVRKNREIYTAELDKVKIVLCDSMTDFRKEIRNRKGFGGAMVKWNKIILITPSKKPENILPYDFTIYHEMNHLLYKKIVGHFKPIWLVEGLALLKQGAYRPKKKTKIALRNNTRSSKLLSVRATQYKKIEERTLFYALSYYVIIYLTKEFGLKKVIKFLNKIPFEYDNKKFWVLFEKLFYLKKEELISNALA